MKKYKSIEVSEKQLEDLIRQGANLIEEGVRYIDHQRNTERGPLDVLMVDSGNALIVAELKIIEDDTMWFKALIITIIFQKILKASQGCIKIFILTPNRLFGFFSLHPASLFLFLIGVSG